MRLVLHIGLHKTASTAFQVLCRDNAARLLDAGVFWRVIDGYPAHHQAAWSLLRGETGAIRDYVAEARGKGASTALLSSEELDYVLHVPQKARAIEVEAQDAGVEEVIWAMALRRPSEAFRSHISELTKHGIHLDPLQGYLEIMRTGGLHFTGRHDGGTQFWNWFFTLDYVRYVTRLRDTVLGTVLAYDYHAADRLPGMPVLRAALRGDETMLATMPPPGRVNPRLHEEEIAANLTEMLKVLGHGEKDIAVLLGARRAAVSYAIVTGSDAILDAGLDARFGDYAGVLGDGGYVSSALETV